MIMNWRVSLCAAAAFALLTSQACAAKQLPADPPADTRCESLTSERPVPANDHSIDAKNYPILSMANGEAGNVVLDFRINTDGSVDDVKVARSSGSAELDGAAVDSVAGHWRYKPPTSQGHSIACRYMATVAWRLPLDPDFLAGLGYAVVQMQRSRLPSDPVSPQSVEPVTGMFLTLGKNGSVILEHLFHHSGYPQLDEAAMTAAKNGTWQIAPASLGGKPLRSTVGLVVVWTR